MLSRFVRDDADHTRKHFFYGSLLILLSLAIGTSLIGYSWQSHSVLGSQSIAQSMQTGSGDGQAPVVGTSGTDGGISAGSGAVQQGGEQGGGQGGNDNTVIIDLPNPTSVPIQINPTSVPVVVIPSSVPQPSQVPIVQQPTPTPIVVGSVPELIDGAGPQTEIVIRNEDNTLVVSTTTDPTHVAIVEPGESLSGQMPSSLPSGTVQDPTVETVLTYDPVSQEYVAVPTSYSDEGSRTTSTTSNTSATSRALTVISDSVQKVFSVESYFPSDSPEKHTTVRLNSLQNNMYDWISKYQFQVWPIGTSHLAIYRNGITTLTRYPIALGLSRQSVRILTEDGFKQLLHYPDSIWQDISAKRIVSEGSHDEPMILTYENDELLYKIQGESKQLLFAFIPTSVCQMVVVSAEDQEVQSIKPCGTKDAVIEALSISFN